MFRVLCDFCGFKKMCESLDEFSVHPTRKLQTSLPKIVDTKMVVGEYKEDSKSMSVKCPQCGRLIKCYKTKNPQKVIDDKVNEEKRKEQQEMENIKYSEEYERKMNELKEKLKNQ